QSELQTGSCGNVENVERVADVTHKQKNDAVVDQHQQHDAEIDPVVQIGLLVLPVQFGAGQNVQRHLHGACGGHPQIDVEAVTLGGLQRKQIGAMGNRSAG